MAEFYFPFQASGHYELTKDPSKPNWVQNGTGTVVWYRGSTPILNQGAGAVAYDAINDKYTAPILATAATVLWEWIIGIVQITGPLGQVYYDRIRAQVRTPSSPAPP